MTERHPAGKILVAEDDRVLAEIIRYNLERAGFDVVVAHDGRTAADRASSERFDLIVSDYQMPRLTGEEFCRVVRQGSPNESTPVIFCSAKGYEVDTEKLREELQLTEIFLKPFSPRELVETVCRNLTVTASAE